MLSPCQCVSGMKVKCFDGISFKILVAFLKKAPTFDTLPHNRPCLLATHLLVCCPPSALLSSLPPPSMPQHGAGSRQLLGPLVVVGQRAPARATQGPASGSHHSLPSPQIHRAPLSVANAWNDRRHVECKVCGN